MTHTFAHRVVPVVAFRISTVRAQKMQKSGSVRYAFSPGGALLRKPIEKSLQELLRGGDRANRTRCFQRLQQF
jgi:hypothetical protein